MRPARRPDAPASVTLAAAGPPLQSSRFTSARGGRFLLALLSGALMGLSYPSASVELFAFVALTPLIIALVNARSRVEAFLLATLSYAVNWLITVPWVVIVMSHYGGLPFALGVGIWVALALVLGMFAGILFGIVVHDLRLRSALAPWILVPASWVLVEFGRTWLLSGFPWDPLAVAIIDLTPLIQVAKFIGTYALGFLVAVPSTVLAWVLLAEASRRRKLAVITGLGVLMILWWSLGSWLLTNERKLMATEARATAAVLQPNISQEMRWDASEVSELFIRMEDLTRRGIEAGADVVIWPESSIPLTYMTVPFYRDLVESFSREGNVDIILGSVAEDPRDPEKIWNAAYLVTDGETKARYDKIRLVPFGEYVPLRTALFFAKKLVREVGNFQFGIDDRPLRGKFAYGPAICYEVVFPQITATQVRHGATVLVTITNDGWFGESAARQQHLNNARLRAVEDHRYLLRSATSGISAVVDPTGRVVRSLGSGQEGVILAGFAPREDQTLYVRFGDWFFYVALLGVLIGWMGRRRS